MAVSGGASGASPTRAPRDPRFDPDHLYQEAHDHDVDAAMLSRIKYAIAGRPDLVRWAEQAEERHRTAAATARVVADALANGRNSTAWANPFREGSNLRVLTELLVRGGRRRDLALAASRVIKIHPYRKEHDDVDLDDFDKRLLLAAQQLRDRHGYRIERTGRGINGTIRVIPPG